MTSRLLARQDSTSTAVAAGDSVGPAGSVGAVYSGEETRPLRLMFGGGEGGDRAAGAGSPAPLLEIGEREGGEGKGDDGGGKGDAAETSVDSAGSPEQSLLEYARRVSEKLARML